MADPPDQLAVLEDLIANVRQSGVVSGAAVASAGIAEKLLSLECTDLNFSRYALVRDLRARIAQSMGPALEEHIAALRNADAVGAHEAAIAEANLAETLASRREFQELLADAARELRAAVETAGGGRAAPRRAEVEEEEEEEVNFFDDGDGPAPGGGGGVVLWQRGDSDSDSDSNFSVSSIPPYDEMRAVAGQMAPEQPAGTRRGAMAAAAHFSPGDILSSEHWPALCAALGAALADSEPPIAREALLLHAALFRAASPVQTGAPAPPRRAMGELPGLADGGADDGHLPPAAPRARGARRAPEAFATAGEYAAGVDPLAAWFDAWSAGARMRAALARAATATGLLPDLVACALAHAPEGPAPGPACRPLLGPAPRVRAVPRHLVAALGRRLRAALQRGAPRRGPGSRPSSPPSSPPPPPPRPSPRARRRRRRHTARCRCPPRRSPRPPPPRAGRRPGEGPLARLAALAAALAARKLPLACGGGPEEREEAAAGVSAAFASALAPLLRCPRAGPAALAPGLPEALHRRLAAAERRRPGALAAAARALLPALAHRPPRPGALWALHALAGSPAGAAALAEAGLFERCARELPAALAADGPAPGAPGAPALLAPLAALFASPETRQALEPFEEGHGAGLRLLAAAACSSLDSLALLEARLGPRAALRALQRDAPLHPALGCPADPLSLLRRRLLALTGSIGGRGERRVPAASLPDVGLRWAPPPNIDSAVTVEELMSREAPGSAAWNALRQQQARAPPAPQAPPSPAPQFPLRIHQVWTPAEGTRPRLSPPPLPPSAWADPSEPQHHPAPSPAAAPSRPIPGGAPEPVAPPEAIAVPVDSDDEAPPAASEASPAERAAAEEAVAAVAGALRGGEPDALPSAVAALLRLRGPALRAAAAGALEAWAEFRGPAPPPVGSGVSVRGRRGAEEAEAEAAETFAAGLLAKYAVALGVAPPSEAPALAAAARRLSRRSAARPCASAACSARRGAFDWLAGVLLILCGGDEPRAAALLEALAAHAAGALAALAPRRCCTCGEAEPAPVRVAHAVDRLLAAQAPALYGAFAASGLPPSAVASLWCGQALLNALPADDVARGACLAVLLGPDALAAFLAAALELAGPTLLPAARDGRLRERALEEPLQLGPGADLADDRGAGRVLELWRSLSQDDPAGAR
eukprot:tig00000880_g5188.t1